MLNPLEKHQIEKILKAHCKWIHSNGEDGSKADFSNAVIYDFDVHGENLIGVDFENTYFCETNIIKSDLSGANLSNTKLERANIRGTILREAKMSNINLNHSVLIDADLSCAKITNAEIKNADLAGINLMGSDLSYTNLSKSFLTGANFEGACLFGADLTQASLGGAKFFNTNLDNTNFDKAILYFTFFAFTDLSKVKHLETCQHRNLSSVDQNTLLNSSHLPVPFLKGIGLSDNLIQRPQSYRYYSCFISYCQKDKEFADKLHADLVNNGVLCWFDQKDMKIGARIRKTIEESIKSKDKLLIIISNRSIRSQWVEKEVETAFEEEKSRGFVKLLPIRLDDDVIKTDEAWAADIRRSRHIGDFTNWKDHDSYQKAFQRLLRDLKAE